ncbi:GNAT family N-acetyltransferase [Reinekea sp.]|jgi:diamine N-acetyltransferase|uniref:GNAT family N-acetyltransferase n=1 Tax=Reinekea sp. TaxID=1970455 RepID=UPI00398A0639
MFEFNNFQMKIIQPKDLDPYYYFGFCDISEETRYFTGTTEHFTKEQIESYILNISEDTTRYDFLISEGDEIVGEAVLSDINGNNCHFRIAIFNKKNFSSGIGFSATKILLDFAFSELDLEVVELEVFPFNERGIALYSKLGFNLVDQVIDDEAKEPYREILIMRLNKENYVRSLN